MRPDDQTEQLAREIAREAGFLPERWRLWLLDQIADEVAAFDSEKHRDRQLNQRMSQAVEALKRVAQHLQLSDEEALTRLTMREFDAAPSSIREEWKARQIADLIRGSWGVAKSVAFANGILPVKAEIDRRRNKQLARKRREGALPFSGIQQWLESEPKDKRRVTYDHWVRQQNQQLPEDQKSFLLAKTIQRRWPFPWPEIVQAVEGGHLPGEDTEPREGEPVEQTDPDPSEPIAEINLDLQLDHERLRSTREARGLEIHQLGSQAGMDISNLRKIERGEITNPSLLTIAKLAAVLKLSIDDLIVNHA